MLSSHETSPKSGLSQLTSTRQPADEAFKILSSVDEAPVIDTGDIHFESHEDDGTMGKTHWL